MIMTKKVQVGVTLLETLVAGTIVLLVLLSLLGTIAFGLKGVQNAEGNQEAVFHARRLFEYIRENRLAERVVYPPHIGFADLPSDRILLEAAPFDTVEEFQSNNRYTRRIVTERLSTDLSDHRSRLYRVEVTVFWEIRSGESSYQLVGYYRAL